MALIVHGKVINKGSEHVVEDSAPVQEPVIEEIETDVLEASSYDFHPDKTYLVVDGKVKEIGKKSKYLIDMLTIND